MDGGGGAVTLGLLEAAPVSTLLASAAVLEPARDAAGRESACKETNIIYYL